MRLERLDLTRFGKFTDLTLDFGAPEGDVPDLHIVYGPNEAGKSTLCAAFLDFLYGVPHATGYGYLHGYDAMQVGARIKTHDGVHDLVRIKRRNEALLDTAGRPLPESILQLALGGIDRDAYRAMFYLDDDTLEAGGESILKSRNDLGRILFSASAGLSGTAAAIETMRAQADGFYRPHARRRLNELKGEIEDIQTQRRSFDIHAGSYAELREKLEAHETAHRLASERLKDARAEQLRLERLQGFVPLAADLLEARRQLALLPAGPRPRHELRERFALLPARRETLAAAIGVEDAALERIAGAAAALLLDEPALACLSRQEAVEALRPDYDLSVRDLPGLRERARSLTNEICATLARIDREKEAAEETLVPSQAIALLRGLIVEHAQISERRSSAAEALALACSERDLRLREVPPETSDPAAVEILAGLVAQYDAHDPRQELARTETDLAEREADVLEARRVVLAYGDIAGAERLPTADEVEEVECALSLASDADEQAIAVCAHVENALGAAEPFDAADRGPTPGREAAHHASAGRILDQAAEIRAEREAAWQRHLTLLDRDSAASFEKSMRRDDAFAAHLLAAEREGAHLEARDEERRKLMVEQSAARRRRADAQEALSRVRDVIAGNLPGLRTEALNALRPGSYRNLIAALQRVIEKSDACSRARRARARAERALEETRTSLRKSLVAANADAASCDDAPLDVLVARARALLERERRAKGAREALARQEDAVMRAQASMDRAMADERDWRERYARAREGTWLATAALEPVALEAVLGELVELAENVRRRREVEEDIDRCETSRDAFAREVLALGAQIGMMSEDVGSLWRAMVDRMEAARDAERERERLQREHAETVERRAGDARALQDIADEIEAMCQELGQADESALAEIFGICTQRDTLENTIAGIEERFRQGWRSQSLESVLSEIEAIEADQLGAEIEACTALVARLTDEERKAHDALRDARAQLEAVGADGAVARLEQQRRTLLVEIEAGARAYLRDRLGALVLDDALRRYREAHRGAMMQRASEAFAAITEGAYSGLSTKLERERELLIALPRGGSSRFVDQLSKGTRFQLYLALRLAAYEEFAKAGRAVPFVADDIMETFDETRSRQAFGLLAQMARAGQVVYLTHHRHLVEIARDVCPQVSVHELAPLEEREASAHAA